MAQAVRAAAARLAAAGIADGRREARLLLAHALGLSTGDAVMNPDRIVCVDRFESLVSRRARREPLALITGHREFWSLDFAVSADTLIPRSDSETLIQAALAAFPDRHAALRILDLGTGTGCLLLAALHEFPAGFGIGIDRNPDAASLAQRNAIALSLSGRAAFLCGDWTAPLDGRFDLILCNPPYIPAGEIPRLMPEVARYEPASALSGGSDGLDAYRAVIPRLAGLQSPHAVTILEVGHDQAAAVVRLAEAAGLVASLRADLAGIDRAVVLRPAG